MHTRYLPLFVVIVFVLSVASFASEDSPHVSKAPGQFLLSGDSLISHVKWLADDARGGRATGEPGARAASAWLASHFESLDLTPAGDNGTFFQNYEATVGVEIGEENQLSLPGASELEAGNDFIPFGFSNNSSLEGTPMIFAGYGITDEEDAYDDYAGIDVTGKAVVVLRHEPQIDDPHSVFAGDAFSSHAAFRSKAENAREHGAVAMLLITGPKSKEYEEDKLTPLNSSQGIGGGGLSAVHVKHALLEPILEQAGVDLKQWTDAVDESLEPNSVDLGVAISLKTEVKKNRKPTRNVVAMIPGRNPQAGYVLIGAHYDHLGYGEHSSLSPESKGEVHNGADDNASGTSALLELARVFRTTGSTERGLIFVAFSGEELGLLGSAYYVDNPAVPLDQLQVMINLDMIGRPQKETITVSGTGSSPEFQPLMDKLESMADLHISRDSSGFAASDNTSFYAKDVPVLFFFSGLHEDYHRPTDDWEKIDVEGYLETVQLVYDVILDLANRPGKVEFVRAQKDSAGSHGAGDTSGGGYGPYLGTIPSFGDREEPGVELTGVRAGSPAEKAGIQGGDVVIRFGDREITDLYAYTYALRDHKAGDVVEIVVLRDGRELALTATLGERE